MIMVPVGTLSSGGGWHEITENEGRNNVNGSDRTMYVIMLVIDTVYGHTVEDEN